jgi:hypothetical protein
MKNRKRGAQGLAVFGSVAMLVSAGFHGTLGYQNVVAAVAGKGVDPTIFPALKAIWLIVS